MWKPLFTSVAVSRVLVEACVSLHNFLIDERDMQVDSHSYQESSSETILSPASDAELARELPNRRSSGERGVSQWRRDALRMKQREAGLVFHSDHDYFFA